MKAAACFTIKNVPGMTVKGRRQIVAWMRHQAALMLKHGDDYTEGHFRARFHYEPVKKKTR